MVTRELTLRNPDGLHIHPSRVLVELVKSHRCSCRLEFKGRDVRMDCVVSLVSQDIRCGDPFLLICDGDDEMEALESITKAVQSGLGDRIDVPSM